MGRPAAGMRASGAWPGWLANSRSRDTAKHRQANIRARRGACCQPTDSEFSPPIDERVRADLDPRNSAVRQLDESQRRTVRADTVEEVIAARIMASHARPCPLRSARRRHAVVRGQVHQSCAGSRTWSSSIGGSSSTAPTLQSPLGPEVEPPEQASAGEQKPGPSGAELGRLEEESIGGARECQRSVDDTGIHTSPPCPGLNLSGSSPASSANLSLASFSQL